MKNFKLGLFPRVLIAITCGALLGLVAPDVLVRIFKTFNVLFSQLLKFIVPLLVLGLVTPAIAGVGRRAGKMLLTVMAIAYLSTILSGFFAHVCATNLFPHYLSAGEFTSEAVSAKEYLPYFELKIPPLCDIMTALVLSFMVGVGIIFTDSRALKTGCEEFGAIVKFTIEKAVIPLLPLYIFTMICEMSARGVIASILGAGLKVILTGVLLSICYLVFQYCVACAFARKNPFVCLWNMLPAYLTGLSIASSSAVIPVTLDCCAKNGISEEVRGFVVPLCANVHMVGSAIKMIASTLAVAIIYDLDIGFAQVAHFTAMFAIAAVAAPGVMCGVLMASVGFLDSILGLTPDQIAVMMTFYMALDGYGPAANVTGDGAIALVADRFFGRAGAADRVGQ